MIPTPRTDEKEFTAREFEGEFKELVQVVEVDVARGLERELYGKTKYLEQSNDNEERLIKERDELRAEVEKLEQQEQLVADALPNDFEGSEETFGTIVRQIVQERDELKTSLAAHIEALRLCSIQCEHLHHAKADRHEIGEPCPVVARIQPLIQNPEPSKEK